MKQPPADPAVLSVSQLTHQVRDLLEGTFPVAWVQGEISNFVAHRSGHWYFTLKDAGASLSAAMFRGQNRRVRFDPEHGMEVVCRGRISVYPPRGNYQLIVDRIEPCGVGELQLAFEQLRRKLDAEGLFDPARKRPLPRLPVRIGIVTSPTGAAVRDMLRVLGQRFQPLEIRIAPARVQGTGAAREVAAGLDLLNREGRVQLILCGRGGGSLEDLWAFNEEEVARAIARSRIPVISAVGHEVDVTIADLVADARAATPSNAAEIAVPVRAELDAYLGDLRERLARSTDRELDRRRLVSTQLAKRLIDPRRHLQIQAQRRDELFSRLRRAGEVAQGARRAALAQAAGRLDALSPLGVLSRGYAIALRSGRPLRDAAEASAGDGIEVRLHRGTLECSIDAVTVEEESR